ncbi:MAG: hypothetical protein DMF49_03465, partial [Acidobacteria bacterium]
MVRTQTILFTGATGFLGSRLAARLAARGHRLVCLVRASDDRSAEATVRAAIGRHLLPECRSALLCSGRLGACRADLSQPNLGLDGRGMTLLRDAPPSLVVNTAAELSMEPGSAMACRRVNVFGTERLARLALSIGTKSFHHVSTAYVHGRCGGKAREIIPSRPCHRNPYERTKWQAERQLRRFARRMRVTIWRPTILVQDPWEPPDPRSSGLVSIMRIIDLAARVARREGLDGTPVRIAIDPDIPVNLVPVTGMVIAMTWVIERASLHGGVYQFAHPSPVGQQAVVEAIGRRHPDLRLVGARKEEILRSRCRPSERLFLEWRGPLAAYQESGGHFDCSRMSAALKGSGLAFPAIAAEWLDALARQACDEADWRTGTSGQSPYWPLRPLPEEGAIE